VLGVHSGGEDAVTYRNDPQWQSAQRDFIDPGPGTADERSTARKRAARRMYEIEVGHE
jgi:hypothetical protein